MKSNARQRDSGIEVTAQGKLLTVTPFRQYKLFPLNHDRGKVTGFSPKSRKRLLELIAKLKNVDIKGYRSRTSFLTLTTRHKHHPTHFKPLLFTWLKRLHRKNPQLSAIWRIEPQKRGATHAHLILYNAPYIDKWWIQKSWGEVVDQSHPFTRIERVKSYKHIMSYASKYIAKSSDGFNNVPYLTVQSTGEILSPGRQWGIFNREFLPFAEVTTVILDLDGSWWLIRRYCQRLWSGLDITDASGFTIFCDEPEYALLALKKIATQFSLAKLA